MIIFYTDMFRHQKQFEKIFTLPEAHYAVIKKKIFIKNYWKIKVGNKKFLKQNN